MKRSDIRAAVITISDRCAEGTMDDKSGPVIRDLLEEQGYSMSSYILIPDDAVLIRKSLTELADENTDLIITTGGTGFSPRDVTPEATLAVCHRQAPGIAEAIRAKSMEITPRAMLSRAVAGIRGRTLIVNFPGSPSACREAFSVIEGQIDHAIGLLRGEKMDK